MATPKEQPTPPRRYWEPRVNAKEEPMRRRAFIAAAVAATGAGVPIPAALADTAVAAPDRLNGSTTLTSAVHLLESDIWQTGADYVAPGSAPARADLHQVAIWQWAQANRAANRAHRAPAPLRLKALSVEAEAARQVAMMHADRSQHASATRMYKHAITTAERAGEPELLAWIYTSRAYMPLYGGSPASALLLANHALQCLTKAERPGGRAAACAWALLARCQAMHGDTGSANHAIRNANTSMRRYGDAGSTTLPAPHHPQRFAWVKLRLATAEVYAAAGDRARHDRSYDDAMADPSVSAMHRPMLDLGRAEVTHDPAAAAQHALTALRTMAHPPNPVIGRARALATRAAARDPRSEPIQQLRAHLLRLPR